MTSRSLLCVFILSPCQLVTLSPCHARADGGTLRLRQQAGGYQITVFTAPTPLCAGPVDISVLVLDDATGEPLPAARVVVRLTACGSGDVREHTADAVATTNKLFRSAVIELPKSGWWDVEVAVTGPRGGAVVQFALEADEPPPPWRDLWPWLAWPALAVALFALHQRTTCRRYAVIRR
jgi:hypothetical protein